MCPPAVYLGHILVEASQTPYTCIENVIKTRFQDVQTVYSEDVHKP